MLPLIFPVLGALFGLGSADELDEAYISFTDVGEIRRFDLVNGTIEEFTVGLKAPFYGEWGPREGASQERFLYMPDTHFRALWKIAPDGAKQLLSFRGLLQAPTQVAFHPITHELYMSDGTAQSVFRIDTQTGDATVFADNSSGLFGYPGGMGFAPDGTLYVSDVIRQTVLEVDDQGVVTPFFDFGAVGLDQPAGTQVDGAGNVYVASHLTDLIVRIRRDGDGWEVFSDDALLDDPADIKLTRSGGLLVVSEETTSLTRIDPRGDVTLLGQDASWGGWFGVAVPGDFPACEGRIEEFGAGTAGEGGHVPRLAGIYSPGPGVSVAYEIDRGRGGDRGFLLWGTREGQLDVFGGTIYVDFGGVWDLLPVKLQGSGAGEGRLRVQVNNPDNPALEGFVFYMQALLQDTSTPFKVSMSNAVRTTYGS